MRTLKRFIHDFRGFAKNVEAAKVCKARWGGGCFLLVGEKLMEGF